MSVACVEYVSDCRNCGLDHTIFLKKDGSISGMFRPGDLKYSSAYDTVPGSGNGRYRHHRLNRQDFPTLLRLTAVTRRLSAPVLYETLVAFLAAPWVFQVKTAYGCGWARKGWRLAGPTKPI